MKRINNLYSKICSMDNLALADKKARAGKSKQLDIIEHNKQAGTNLYKLHT
jgi:hypothetical protein